VAKKIQGLERVLDVPSLAAVAYGEIASSIYFALGIIAAHALGLTPLVLLLVGLLFLLVALGVVMLVVTLWHGGGVGVVLGALFVVAGAGRLWLLRRRAT